MSAANMTTTRMATTSMAAHPMTALPVAALPMAPFFMAAPIKHAPMPTNINPSQMAGHVGNNGYINQPTVSTAHHVPQINNYHINNNVNQPPTNNITTAPRMVTPANTIQRHQADGTINQPILNDAIHRPRRTAQRVTKLRKSCNRCHGRKLKCIIVQGTDPKFCTECQKKGLTCVFEAKKPYVRKTAT